jgi:membrane-associated phospholipid phosphatase
VSYLYPFERRVLRQRQRRTAILALVALLFAALLDETVYGWLNVGDERRMPLEARDWYRTFRVAGTLYPWVLICGAIAVIRLGRTRAAAATRDDNPGRALLVFLSAALSGGLAELLQMLVGRLRPDRALETGHAFRGLIARFRDTSALSFPSSHAAVAFGAAFALSRFWPGPGAVALIAAAACGLTRLLAGAHYLSDVVGGAFAGYACSLILVPGPRRSLLIP